MPFKSAGGGGGGEKESVRNIIQGFLRLIVTSSSPDCNYFKMERGPKTSQCVPCGRGDVLPMIRTSVKQVQMPACDSLVTARAARRDANARTRAAKSSEIKRQLSRPPVTFFYDNKPHLGIDLRRNPLQIDPPTAPPAPFFLAGAQSWRCCSENPSCPFTRGFLWWGGRGGENFSKDK